MPPGLGGQVIQEIPAALDLPPGTRRTRHRQKVVSQTWGAGQDLFPLQQGFRFPVLSTH